MSDAGKRAAGEAAAAMVEDGMRLGLGTGSTVAFFLDALGARGLAVSGVPTSDWTAQRCRELGIGVLDPGEVTRLDLAVDGADELTPDLALTKGGGGAHLREKVVASLADRFVVIATPDKVVDRLGDTFPVPVEVVPFAVPSVTRELEALGLEVRVRGGADSYRTDNGNAVLDCRLDGGFEDPEVADLAIAMLTGVAATGLFNGLATDAILGRADGGVERLPA
ncbi:ribose-5-phosphate isomerase RpiA [Nitriliruptor alkaliphilus]|uniref:ribose-5-phosphate isomerase RpiA n=1 Tax=Nitriliruptor alkaliphilus TaxID=427918 RepID=UPI000698D79C|nr:ribose-5-phosphate isomerase RpiA [Nitriliruptor alkaliphilus]